MRFGLAVWLIGFVPLAEWRKAEMLKLPVFTGVPEDSASRQSANCVFYERADVRMRKLWEAREMLVLRRIRTSAYSHVGW